MNIEDTIRNINFGLLREQKMRLIGMANKIKTLKLDVEALDGVIALLDAIQDAAVEDGMATEVEVFGESQGEET